MYRYDEYSPYEKRVAKIAEVIQRHAGESDAQRHLSAEVAAAMSEEGLYRLGVPVSVGGHEAHPVVQVQTIEAVSRLHGSAGWNLMIGMEVMGALSVQYPQESVRNLFADPTLIVSGALNPVGRAERCDLGYRVSGQWPFASGCHNAGWFWGQSVVYNQGEQEKGDRGPVTIETLIPRADFEILDTWKVTGMRGSGSHDVSVRDLFVSDEYVSSTQRGQVTEQGTLYRLPAYSRLVYNKTGVALGIARAAIDAFEELASAKKPRGSSRQLRERVDAQRAAAEAERIIGSARSYAFEQVELLWETVEKGDRPSKKQRALLQLAGSGVANEAVKAVDVLFTAAGASANFEDNPLARCMRDILVVRQHIMVSPQYTESIGRVLLGLDSGTFLF